MHMKQTNLFEVWCHAWISAFSTVFAIFLEEMHSELKPGKTSRSSFKFSVERKFNRNSIIWL